VVLEAGEPFHAECRIDVGYYLTDPAALTTAAADVEQAGSCPASSLDLSHHLVGWTI
jgi:hypothetical protein